MGTETEFISVRRQGGGWGWSIYFDDPVESRVSVARQSRVVYASYESAYRDAQIAFEQVEANRAGRRSMRVFYLIDPVARVVEAIRDGFDRAVFYLHAEEHELATLWTHTFDFDSTVDILAVDEGVLEEPWSQSYFSYRFTCGSKTTERIFAGIGIVAACGEIPEDIAEQLRTLEAVSRAVSFLSEHEARGWRADRAIDGSPDHRIVHLHDHLTEQVDLSARKGFVRRATASRDQNPKMPARRGQK
ncbi:hypothetical protein AWB67_05925 [Caballeronia terrestris]|uniref:Uncharacterized protein n=1 Tax=Caballeronia terrestris TaxID=1226301 RepID=A0A158KKT3_9BURK|nr:hypothetical protein [Caballeronia terrestris]SAL81736.1 hypothetical protein AWB67_05925 [Caballeronia terrestris]